MANKVKLKDLIDQMDITQEEMAAYLDRTTGKIIAVTDEEMRLAEDDGEENDIPEWQKDLVEAAKEFIAGPPERFVELPGKYEIHEWKIMEQFCDTVDVPSVANDLNRAIHGSGAFRNFRNRLQHHGIEDRWFAFRLKALRDMAVGWCEDNEIEYCGEEAVASSQ